MKVNQTALLIPHFNNPEGLYSSIKSIHKSENIDVVIVDDGSTDNKFNELELNDIFKSGTNVYYLYLDSNKGIEHALNYGLAFIKSKNYKYTARLDAGDLCEPNRFQIQENFLENNTNIKLVGSGIIAIDEKGIELYRKEFPETHIELKRKMYLNCMFIHPTVMFANDVIDAIGDYPTNFNAAEDYAFFFKILNSFETANIKEPLVKIEINHSGISIQKRKQQVASRIKIIKKYFYFGFWPIYGLFRNYMLYIIPNSFLLFLKKL